MEKKKQQDKAADALDQLLARAAEAPTEPDEAPADDTADNTASEADDEATDEAAEKAAEKAARHEREERARKAFHQLTDIDDEDESAMSLRGILGGDILGGRTFRRQALYLLMLCAMAIVYVANRYACQREEIRREELARDLADRKFKALTIAAELTEYSMRRNVEENLRDTTLRTSTRASYYLYVPAADTTATAAD